MDFVAQPLVNFNSLVIVYPSSPDLRALSLRYRILPVTMPPPRPSHIAEREELDAALSEGTVAALELFLDRHPQSRYRAEAEAALQARLRQTRPKN